VADNATIQSSYALTFGALLVANTATVAAAYALLIDNGSIRCSLAATLLVVVVVAQTVRYGPFLPMLCWVSTVPVAIGMALLVAAHPVLDWSGTGEPDQLDLTPIVPVIAVAYATGFAFIAGTAHWGYLAIRNGQSRSRKR
jgi:hypothetical protein